MNWQNYRFMKYRDIYVPAKDMPQGRMFVSGEVRFMKYNSMGQLNYDSGWRDNLITNTGLDTIGGVSQYAYPMRYNCYLGTSNTPSDVSMFQLVAPIGTSEGQSYLFDNAWNEGAPNYKRVVQDGYRFAPGNATGTLQEVGFHPNDIDKMFARHVISPAIVKASDETLDVHHRFKIAPDVSSPDQTGQCTLEGELFNWACRPWNLGYSDWGELRGIGSPLRVDSFPSYKAYAVNTDLQPNNTGTLNPDYTGGWGYGDAATGFINTSPASGGDSGCSVNGDGPPGHVTYTPGSYRADFFYLSGLDGGNLIADPDGMGPGIRRVILGTTWYDLQVAFYRVSDGFRVPKDNTRTMQIEWSMTWARL